MVEPQIGRTYRAVPNSSNPVCNDKIITATGSLQYEASFGLIRVRSMINASVLTSETREALALLIVREKILCVKRSMLLKKLSSIFHMPIVEKISQGPCCLASVALIDCETKVLSHVYYRMRLWSR